MVAGDIEHWCSLDRAKLTLPLEDDLVLSTAQTMLAQHAAALNSTVVSAVTAHSQRSERRWAG